MKGAEQLNFFNEAEIKAEASIENIEKVVIFKARKKNTHTTNHLKNLKLKKSYTRLKTDYVPNVKAKWKLWTKILYVRK